MFKNLICGLCAVATFSVHAMQENRVDVYRRANLEAAAGAHINAHLEGFMHANSDREAVDSIVSALKYFKNSPKCSIPVKAVIRALSILGNHVDIVVNNTSKSVTFGVGAMIAENVHNTFPSCNRIYYNDKYNLRLIEPKLNDVYYSYGVRVEDIEQENRQKDIWSSCDDDMFGDMSEGETIVYSEDE